MLTGVTSPAAATRGLKASPLQRISEIVLIVGTRAAAAAASGSIWVVRLVALAIATALVSCASPGVRSTQPDALMHKPCSRPHVSTVRC